MQRNQFEKNWNHIKNEIQKRWNRLTAEDIYEIDGMYDQLIHVLTKRYNSSWEKVEKEVGDWQPKVMERGEEEGWTGEAAGDESPETHEERQTRKVHGKRKVEISGWKREEDWKHKKRKAG